MEKKLMAQIAWEPAPERGTHHFKASVFTLKNFVTGEQIDHPLLH